jgi:hypothetical protein
MNEHESEFDDPGFKAAVRRTVGREGAPPSLRAKVQSLMTAESADVAGRIGGDDAGGDRVSTAAAATPAKARGRRRLAVDRGFWRTAAAAACVLLALGWLAYQIREQFFPPAPYAAGPGNTLIAIPNSLVLEMVRTHDNCAKLEDHHKLPGDNPEALREKLTAGSGVAASTVNLGGEWKFKGAGVCQVGDKQAAHLLFARADEFVSVFSMAATEECGYGSDPYKELVEKHAIAGFRHGDALYCVVASAGKRAMAKEEIDPLLQRLQASVATGCSSHNAMVAAASTPPGSSGSGARQH